jgi:hypothetical protein
VRDGATSLARPERHDRPGAVRASRRRLVLVAAIASLSAAGAAALGCGGRAGRPGAEASATREAGDGARRGACEGCHAAIAEEWRASHHRRAFVDGTFQQSLALEAPQERAFCINCHAPAGARAGVEVGVDCLTCHAAPHADRDAGPSRAPHANDAPVAGPDAVCAPCHEFSFPGRAELIQLTVSEHAASAYADVGCADCHMPSRAGHRDHRFLAGHAPATITPAVRVEAARSGADALRVTIRVAAGHAFPTGDMFRRARLMLFAEGARGEIVADAERTFGRTWGGIERGPHAGARTQTSDTRIRGEWQESVTLDSPTAAIVRVRWSLLYERVVAMQGAHVSVVASDVLQEGEVRW